MVAFTWKDLRKTAKHLRSVQAGCLDGQMKYKWWRVSELKKSFCMSVVGNICCTIVLQPFAHSIVCSNASAMTNTNRSRLNRVTHSKEREIINNNGIFY
jgi:hypothetical protein